jgi:hypothetical protein
MISPWLLAIPVVLSVLALAAGVMALLMAANARTLATPTPQMKRLAESLRGQEAEQLLAQLLGQVQGQDARLRELENAAELLRNQLKGAVQKVGLHRFNSEKSMGGNLSFVLVMLDARDHGLMLTCIHSLEAGRIFLRGVVGGQTDHPLLPEEQVAMQQALSS